MNISSIPIKNLAFCYIIFNMLDIWNSLRKSRA